ncbi:hypothetical protein OGAPHI_007392 [Ogataea philodendri]|uniref:Uncharacterized protein n=1 Tax=Ogataea philodendri TaxID=1378263 RepID=A0A9P8NVK8_9ASCO|nr:uncharacterized protein OGAPHI_007392 [Ogataea philodendri]KAH3660187.1 hypothetical protein OGAPHI_007392 [Ogataea philodendri]
MFHASSYSGFVELAGRSLPTSRLYSLEYVNDDVPLTKPIILTSAASVALILKNTSPNGSTELCDTSFGSTLYGMRMFVSSDKDGMEYTTNFLDAPRIATRQKATLPFWVFVPVIPTLDNSPLPNVLWAILEPFFTILTSLEEAVMMLSGTRSAETGEFTCLILAVAGRPVSELIGMISVISPSLESSWSISRNENLPELVISNVKSRPILVPTNITKPGWPYANSMEVG